MVTITCVKCGKTGRMPEEYLNRSVRCKACGSIFRASSLPFPPTSEPETASPAEPTLEPAIEPTPKSPSWSTGWGRQTKLKVEAPEGFRSETSIPRGPGPAPRIPGSIGQVQIGEHVYTLQSGGSGLNLPPKPTTTFGSAGPEPPKPKPTPKPKAPPKPKPTPGADSGRG
jgi:hypothetical protein